MEVQPARASHYSKESSLELTSTQIQSLSDPVTDPLNHSLESSVKRNEKKPAMRQAWVGEIYADLLLDG